MSTQIVTRNGVSWLIGGRWTPPGSHETRPSKPAAEARDLDLDPNRTAFAWLPDSKQVGWFDTAQIRSLRKARPLAAQVASLVPPTNWPWRGTFRLDDDLWWMVAIGATGDVMPGVDIVGTQEDILEAMQSLTAELAMIPHVQSFNTPEESWAFLLSQSIDAPRALPVSGGASMRAASRVLVPVALAAAAAVGGLTWWRHHLAQERLAQQMAAEHLAQENAARMTAQKAAEIQAGVDRVRQYWAAYPKPWSQFTSWDALWTLCAPGPLSINGWSLRSVQCAMAGPSVAITRVWARGPLGTVLSVPPGAQIAPDGNGASSVQTVPVQASVTGSDPGDAATLALGWLGAKQRWGDVLQVTAGQAQPFRPPWPPKTSPEVQKAVGQPPILWRSFEVSITSSVLPTVDAPPFATADFVPLSVQIDYGAQTAQLTLKGIQYAKP